MEIYSAKCKFEYDIETPRLFSKKKNIKHFEAEMDMLEDMSLRYNEDDRIWICVANSETEATYKLFQDGDKVRRYMWSKIHWNLPLYRPNGLEIINITITLVEPYIANGITYKVLKNIVPVNDFVQYYNEQTNKN